MDQVDDHDNLCFKELLNECIEVFRYPWGLEVVPRCIDLSAYACGCSDPFFLRNLSNQSSKWPAQV
jgi:hypothetical protein